jgi:uncharacterized protein YhfF
VNDAEFGAPGDLRDRLVAAILRGEKTATSSLRAEYRADGTDLPEVGGRSRVLDSRDRPVAVIETTEVRVIRAEEIDADFARDEGESFETVADWWEAHAGFWRSCAEDPDWRLGPTPGSWPSASGSSAARDPGEQRPRPGMVDAQARRLPGRERVLD